MDTSPDIPLLTLHMQSKQLLSSLLKYGTSISTLYHIQFSLLSLSPDSPGSSSTTDKQTASRDLEDTVVMSQANGMIRIATAPASMETRKRYSAISDMSPKVRSRTAEGGNKKELKDGGSPLMSPRDGSPSRGHSKSPGADPGGVVFVSVLFREALAIPTSQ